MGVNNKFCFTCLQIAYLLHTHRYLMHSVSWGKLIIIYVQITWRQVDTFPYVWFKLRLAILYGATCTVQDIE